MTLLRRLILVLPLAWASSALAATCPDTLTIKDSTGATKTTCAGDNGGGSFYAQFQLVDITSGANGLAIDASGHVGVTQAGTWNINAITTLPALAAGTALIGKVGIDQTTPGTTNEVQVFNIPTGLTATSNALDVNLKSGALLAGTAIIGKVGIDQTTPGTTNLVQASNMPTGLTATSNALDVNLKSGAGTGLATSANQTAIQGVITAATAPASMSVTGLVYNTALPAPTNGQSVAVQGDASGRLIVSPTSLTVAQGSTTSGQTGYPAIAAVTTAAPSYTNNQSNLLSLTPAGELRSTVTSVAAALHVSTNVDQLNGTTVDTNTGNASAGTLRVAIATSQPNLTTPLNVRATDGTNNSTVKAASTSAVLTDPALVVAPSPNPSTVCTSVKTINQTANTDILTSTNKIHVCVILLGIAGAEQVSIVEGTGSTCATGTAALLGATTADATHGMPLAATGGFAVAADRPWMVTQTTADHLCILKSGANLLSGTIWYIDHS